MSLTLSTKQEPLPVIEDDRNVWQRALMRAEQNGLQLGHHVDAGSVADTWWWTREVSSSSTPGHWHKVTIYRAWDRFSRTFRVSARCDCDGNHHRRACQHVALLIEQLHRWPFPLYTQPSLLLIAPPEPVEELLCPCCGSPVTERESKIDPYGQLRRYDRCPKDGLGLGFEAAIPVSRWAS